MRYKYFTYSDELYHYGRKGMKWGQHIYGDELTNTGRNAVSNFKSSIAGGQGGKATGTARLAASGAGTKDMFSREGGRKDKNGNRYSEAEDMAKNAEKGIRSASDAANKMDKLSRKYNPPKTNNEVKTLSDAELRKRINRMEMERRYTELTTKDTETGWKKAGEVLDVVGDVASIVVTGVTIYATIKGMKRR